MAGGVGVGDGVELGVGVGLAPGVELEAVVLLPPTLPHPVKIKAIDNSTQHTNLGPMGNDLLHTDPFDAAELLECWSPRRALLHEFCPQKTGPFAMGAGQSLAQDTFIGKSLP